MKEFCYRSNVKNLEVQDIYKCPKTHSSNGNGNHLGNIWNEEIQRGTENFSKPSLIRAIFKAYHKEYYVFAVATFINFVIVKCTQPIFLSKLINFFIYKNYTSLDMFTYGGGLCGLMMLSSFLQNHSVFGCNLLAMKIRVAVSSLVYRKVLRLSQQSMTKTAAGQVVNLLSNDLARFDLSLYALYFLWITPLQLSVVIFVIWKKFGVEALVGVTIMILVIVPFEGLLGHLTGRFRKQAAKKTDHRVKMMSELLSGIQVIKIYAWEKAFEKIIHQARNEELSYIRRTSFIRGILASLMIVTSRVGVCITVIFYSLLGFPIKTEVVFFLSVCFHFLQYSLGNMLPLAVTLGSELLVSLNRLQTFLVMEEKPTAKLADPEEKEDYCIRLEKVSASWTKEQITLNNLCTTIVPGNLVVVVGPVGAGKSSLLKLMMGELLATSGTLRMKGNVSFSDQKPWLFPSSIRTNVLFGQEFEATRYRNVIEICGLNQDLEQLPENDRTIVGSRGATLSGGQRARVGLARAVYKEADIYFLDDTLSSLDTNVGKFVFDECILKFLNGKTRILVTHQLQYLKEADHIVVLNKGTIEAQGTFQQLSNSKLDFTKLFPEDEESINTQKQEKICRNKSKDLKQEDENEEKICSTTEIEGINKYDGSIFWYYVNSSGNVLSVGLIVLLLIICQLFLNLSDYWLTVWSEQENIRSSSKTNTLFHNENLSNSTNIKLHDWMYSMNDSFYKWTDLVYINSREHVLVKVDIMRMMYLVIIVTSVSLILIRSIFLFHVCINASKSLHNKMFSCLLAAPLKIFYTNSPGNTLNRFSKDLGAIDELLPKSLSGMLGALLVMFGSMTLIAVSNFAMIFLMIPFSMVLCKMRGWYVTTVKSIRRIEAAVKSPVFSYVGSSMEGLTTIRATKNEDMLIPQFDRYQDVHTGASYLALACSSAFGLWLDMLCISFVCSVVFGFIILDNYIYVSGSFIGLAISQSMTMVGLFQFCIRTLSEVVNNLTSVERIRDYTLLEKEQEVERCQGALSIHTWPSNGKIEFKNVSLRYAPNQKPVLNGLDLGILPSEKIGIVGRTGAGKSSIIASLLRLSEIEGNIIIDGVDTNSVKLKELRRSISVIPQEPVLFSASLRYNVDPYLEFTDERIWNVLEELELKKAIPSLGLEVTEGGNNFSVGQRQLICLARAILRNNKILILDEATANVDIRTDELIQKALKKKFEDCTVLTVSHRLNSIMNSDKILVMDDGLRVEFDHPYVLLQNSNGYLYKLAEELGTATFQSLKDVASESYKNFIINSTMKK
ncbi:hypothetical protein HHI36_006596 [Cryptolaemus montrouzieri]